MKEVAFLMNCKTLINKVLDFPVEFFCRGLAGQMMKYILTHGA